MQNRNSLRWQMVLIICGSIFASFIAFIAIVRYLITSDYENFWKISDEQISQSLAQNVNKLISRPLGLENITFEYLMKLNDQERLNFLQHITKKEHAFESFTIVDSNGVKTTDAMPNNDNLVEWIHKLPGDRSISPAHYSPTTKSLVVSFVHHFNQQNIILSNISLKTVQEFIRDYNRRGHSPVYLLDQTGNAIAQPISIGNGLFNYVNLKYSVPRRDKEGKLIYTETGEFINDEYNFTADQGFVDAVKLVMNGETGYNQYVGRDGKTYYCFYRPVPLPFVNQSWSLLLVQPSHDVLVSVNDMFQQAMAGGLIILIIAVFVVMYISEKTVNPIFQIIAMANRVRAGDLSGQLNIKSNNEIEMLADNINHMIHGLRATQRKSQENETRIKAIAYHDTLTGLPNRMHFMVYLRDMIERSVKSRFYGSLLFVDVDKFKAVNDNYGHAVGDGLLIAFAERIIEIAGRKEIVCRFGGDEFLLFLPGYDYSDTLSVCNRLVKIMREPFIIAGNEFSLSTSIGAAMFPKDADNIDELMEKADAALYVSKRNGRDQYNFYVEGMKTAPREK